MSASVASFSPPPPSSTRPVRLGYQCDQSPDVQTIWGTRNQCALPACTTIVQCFLQWVLKEGTACTFDFKKVDAILQEGENAFETACNTIPNSGDRRRSFVEGLNYFDSLNFFSLKNVFSGPTTPIESMDGLEKFLGEGLQKLQSYPQEDPVGGSIYTRGKTIAVALLRGEGHQDYVFFSSHGSPKAGEKGKKAFIKITQDQSKMIEVLKGFLNSQEGVKGEYQMNIVVRQNEEEKLRSQSCGGAFPSFDAHEEDVVCDPEVKRRVSPVRVIAFLALVAVVAGLGKTFFQKRFASHLPHSRGVIGR